MSMSTSRIARAVAAKDLRIELRSRVVTNQVLPFSGLVMTLFSLFILVQRTFAVETYDGALDSLRVAGVNPQGIFIGKSVALFVQLLILESVLFVAAVVLYRVNVNGSGAVLLVTCVLCATAGLAFVGTLYGGLTAGARGRETLLPLLLLPVVAPVLICATRATESAFRSGGVTVGEGWPWVAVLAVFAAVFGLGGLLSFGSLIEE